ncbi:hypothetical protein [Novosphingobium mangrovi (ex Huang et al. 2023)]|uniref:ATP synthase subunit I n=1 Tax=Novosphingobium mangrovi (ex Huang et al. 2023) TaxID=2976432 RepID=A0ABT2I762_9SPHN|nr:hypothetical protein [Novosphingobium mangrovi (ex Huang et al. 2023)]MCT2400642.1 hypothetical protein [Novosphingobium mangrovi (ex Huang et al. 2023)]
MAGLTILAGGLLLLMNAAIRILQGQLQLRPWDALKRASIVFATIFALRLLAWLAFPTLERDWIAALIYSLGFAIVLGLYSTAYRKPT